MAASQEALEAMWEGRRTAAAKRRHEKWAEEMNEAGYTIIRPMSSNEEQNRFTALAKVEFAAHIIRRLGIHIDQDELEKIINDEPWLLPEDNAQTWRDESAPNDLFKFQPGVVSVK